MTTSPGKLPLPFGEPSPAPQAERAGRRTPPAASPARGDNARLWLCLCFSQLPLELSAGPDVPRAVLTGEKRKPVVLLCDDAAARCGVRPGMPVNAALALVPGLEILHRKPRLEQETLHGLAAWATRFTPLVSLDASGALLLEIAASVGLFGGAGALRAAAISGTRAHGHAVMTAVAPTARGALWLARSGQEAQVTELAWLPGVLARLPVSLPGWPQPVLRTLRRMGIRRLGDCMRLPRDGLARRIGEPYLAEIDEALGRRPEIRPGCRQPGRFCAGLELPAETRESGLLIEALRILLRGLEAHLQSRQAGAQILWVHLRHRAAADTLLRIGLLKPSADSARLLELTAIHLSAAVVPAPVCAVTLEADVADAAPAGDKDLLGRRLDQGERMAGLVERLRVRLGLHAVHGIAPGREHRPEHAWEPVPDPATPGRYRAGETDGGARRPLWLLEEPAALGMQSGLPAFQGPLTLESGPERIETGWWDGHDVRRDYYVARNLRGIRLWIFRDRRKGGWHLHGLFG